MPSSGKKRHPRHKYQSQKSLQTKNNTSPTSRNSLDEELQILDAKLKSRGLIRHQIPKDGACLFRAVAEYIYGSQTLHSKIRNETVDYLAEHKDRFAPFVPAREGQTYETYLDFMRKDKAWGGQIELQAISNRYSVNVIIYSQTESEVLFEIDNGSKTTLRLCFSHGNHYDLVLTENEYAVLSYCQGLVLNLVDEMLSAKEQQKQIGDKSSGVASTAAKEHTYQNFGYNLWLQDIAEVEREDANVAQQLHDEELRHHAPLQGSGEFIEVKTKRKKKKTQPQIEHIRSDKETVNEGTVDSGIVNHSNERVSKRNTTQRFKQQISSVQSPIPNTTDTTATQDNKINNNNNNTTVCSMKRQQVQQQNEAKNTGVVSNPWSQKKNWEVHFKDATNKMHAANSTMSALPATTSSGPSAGSSLSPSAKESESDALCEKSTLRESEEIETQSLSKERTSNNDAIQQTQSAAASAKDPPLSVPPPLSSHSVSRDASMQHHEAEPNASKVGFSVSQSASTSTQFSSLSPATVSSSSKESLTRPTSNVKKLSNSHEAHVIFPESFVKMSSKVNITFGSNDLEKATKVTNSDTVDISSSSLTTASGSSPLQSVTTTNNIGVVVTESSSQSQNSNVGVTSFHNSAPESSQQTTPSPSSRSNESVLQFSTPQSEFSSSCPPIHYPSSPYPIEFVPPYAYPQPLTLPQHTPYHHPWPAIPSFYPMAYYPTVYPFVTYPHPNSTNGYTPPVMYQTPPSAKIDASPVQVVASSNISPLPSVSPVITAIPKEESSPPREISAELAASHTPPLPPSTKGRADVPSTDIQNQNAFK
jgi:hypothetical protein